MQKFIMMTDKTIYVATPGHKSVTLSDRLADPIIRFYSLLVTGAFAISDQYFRYSWPVPSLFVTGTFAIIRDRHLRY